MLFAVQYPSQGNFMKFENYDYSPENHCQINPCTNNNISFIPK